MSKIKHKIFIISLVLIVLTTLFAICYVGFSYYNVDIVERFFHKDYKLLKPSGSLGHGYGIVGSILILIGVLSYMLRKRNRVFSRFGILKYWLEFHIFLCTLGPLLILFHTSFKFGGVVAISFWSMVAVFLSGIVGRYIYIQIPRTIEGRELSLNEVKNLKTDLGGALSTEFNIDKDTCNKILEISKCKISLYSGNIFVSNIKTFINDRMTLRRVKAMIRSENISKQQHKKIISLLKNEISLNRKIERLNTMQNLLKYWHVAHLPFAFIMLIVMIVHVVITILFGYRWIF